jgi:hypothetical protein
LTLIIANFQKFEKKKDSKEKRIKQKFKLSLYPWPYSSSVDVSLVTFELSEVVVSLLSESELEESSSSFPLEIIR